MRNRGQPIMGSRGDSQIKEKAIIENNYIEKIIRNTGKYNVDVDKNS